MSRPSQVLIIGGGVAGPALALFLHNAGIACSVYEAYPFVEGVGGALGLAPNGTKVLAALGLADALERDAAAIASFEFRNDKGAMLARTRLDRQVYGQPMLAVSRARLFQALAGAMRVAGVDAHFEKRLVRLDERDDSVVAHFEDGTIAEGDVLIGADGVRSAVRKHLLPDARAQYTGLIGIGGFTASSVVPLVGEDSMTFVFGRSGFFGYAPADPRSVMWWSNVVRDQELTRQELERSADAVKAELLGRFGQYFDPVPSLIANTSNLIQLNVYDVPSLPVWHSRRVLLIGDAAHAVSPSAGQGAALALEDAMYLAKLLRGSSDRPAALAQFEVDRKRRAEKVVAEGRRRGNDKTVVGPLQQKLRELMIRLLVPLAGRSNRWLYEYEIAW